MHRLEPKGGGRSDAASAGRGPMLASISLETLGTWADWAKEHAFSAYRRVVAGTNGAAPEAKYPQPIYRSNGRGGIVL